MEHPAGGLSEAQQKMLARPERREMPAQQKKILKWILIFFGMMVAFTVLSRAADSITVPMVTETGTAFASTLNFSFSAPGSAESISTLSIPGDEGYRVKEIPVTVGQKVKKGDVLVRFDEEYMQEKLDKAKTDLEKARLQERISNLEEGSDSATKLLEESKQKGLERELEDSNIIQFEKERDIEKAEQALLDAHEDLKKAEADLEKTKGKSQETLVKDADEEAKKAAKDWENAQIAYADAMQAANRAIEDARESYDKTVIGINNSVQSASNPEIGSRSDISSEGLVPGGRNQEGADDDDSNEDTNANNGSEGSDSPPSGMDAASIAQTMNDANKTLSRAQEDYNAAVFKAEKARSEAQQAFNDAQAKVSETRDKPLDEQDAVKTAEAAIETAKKTIKEKEDALQTAIEARDKQIQISDRSIEDKQEEVEEARESDLETQRKEALAAQKDALQSQVGQYDMLEKIDAVIDLEKMIAEGGELLAPQDGTVDKIDVTIGQTTAGGVAVQMSDASKGYRFKATTAAADAKNIKVGDKAMIIPSGETQSSAIEGAVIQSIQALSGEQAGQAEIVASLPATVTDGSLSGELKIEKSSGKYNTCIKASAIIGSNNRYSVLAIREKETILGKQNYVEEISVRVVARDTENIALEDGSIFAGEVIVVRATKPLSNNDRVRVQLTE